MKEFKNIDSKGEERITNYLDKHGYFHMSKPYLSGEKPVPDKAEGYPGLYLKRELLYIDNGFMAYPDFEVISDNHWCSIEFDGQPGHFKPLDAFGGIAGFISAHSSDLRKDIYWESCKMPHLRIRYDQYDEIEERLDDFFSHPENYIDSHSRENWNHYYDEWVQHFNIFVEEQSNNPDKRYILNLLKESSNGTKVYYFAEIKKSGEQKTESIIFV